jgi:hypothetical protein
MGQLAKKGLTAAAGVALDAVKANKHKPLPDGNMTMPRQKKSAVFSNLSAHTPLNKIFKTTVSRAVLKRNTEPVSF